jgi:hypothetical protein
VAIWRFQDGTVLRTGGIVRGKGAIADELRTRLAEPRTTVQIYPLPMRGERLDPSSDFLLDALVADTRFAYSSDYERDDADAPPAVRAKLAAVRKQRDETPFGTVN